MKRDFQEEYQNYIESDMPDLWSRIEPNLKEKKGKTEEEQTVAQKAEGSGEREVQKAKGEAQKAEREAQEIKGRGEKDKGKEAEKNPETGKEQKNKIIYLMKRAVPAAACLCALIIGFNVMRVSKNSADMAPMESACEEPSDAGAAYETELEEAADEAAEEAAEAPMEACEDAASDESFDDADDAVTESAAPADMSSEYTENDETPVIQGAKEENIHETDPAGGADRNKAQAEAAGSLAEAGENAVEIERAVLYKIAVVSEEMQEKGYAYAYTFRLEDGSSLKVYLTKEQCADIEERGIEIKRKEAYSLRVYPLKNAGNDRNAENGEGILEKIEKIP